MSRTFLISLAIALLLAGCASTPKQVFDVEGHPFRFAGRMDKVLCIGFYAREGDIAELKQQFRQGMGENAKYVKTSNVPCDSTGALGQCTISRHDGHAITFVYADFVLPKFQSDCVAKGNVYKKL